MGVWKRIDDLLWKRTRLHIYRAEVLRRLERYQDALEASNRAIESDRMDPAAYHEKSANLYRLKRDIEALEAIEQAIVLEPDSECFYRQKAEILASLRHYDEALAAYDQAIHLDLDSDYSYWLKVRFLKQIGRDEDVLATHDQFKSRISKWKNRSLQERQVAGILPFGKALLLYSVR